MRENRYPALFPFNVGDVAEEIKFLDNIIHHPVNLLYSGNPGDSANTVLANAARAQVDYAT